MKLPDIGQIMIAKSKLHLKLPTRIQIKIEIDSKISIKTKISREKPELNSTGFQLSLYMSFSRSFLEQTSSKPRIKLELLSFIWAFF